MCPLGKYAGAYRAGIRARLIRLSVITTGSLRAHGEHTGYARVYLYGFGWGWLGCLGGSRGGFRPFLENLVKRNRSKRGIDLTYPF